MTNDKSPMVRKLAQEALEKIGGELPNHQEEEAKAERDKALEPTDREAPKMRETTTKSKSNAAIESEARPELIPSLAGAAGTDSRAITP